MIIEWLCEYNYHFHGDCYLGVETFNGCLVMIKIIISLFTTLLASKLDVLFEHVENLSYTGDYLKQRLFKVLFHVNLSFSRVKKNHRKILILELTLVQFDSEMLSKIKLKVLKGSCEFLLWNSWVIVLIGYQNWKCGFASIFAAEK